MQIYGTRKCALTRKAERFFRDRGIAYHFVDIAKHPPSRGELENIRKGLPAGESLINTASPAFVKRGLAYMDFDEAEELLADPLLLRTPLVREGSRVIAGGDEAAWETLAKEIKR
ncbi:MAG: glutaredoxin [Spirochaetaceae bacterium]|nr:glutaredoxin [Spirochaetaceae bacterium]